MHPQIFWLLNPNDTCEAYVVCIQTLFTTWALFNLHVYLSTSAIALPDHVSIMYRVYKMSVCLFHYQRRSLLRCYGMTIKREQGKQDTYLDLWNW